MERMVQALVEGFVSTTRKAVLGLTAFWRSVSVPSMAEDIAKRLVILGPEFLLFGALKRFLGGSGGIASVAIFMLEIIFELRPWKKD